MERFEQVRNQPIDIFPFPEEGELVLENPPCLIWLRDKANDGSGYTVTLRGEDGTSYRYVTGNCFVRPDAPLPAGRYEWNVLSSGERERGTMRFEIAENAITFIPPTGDEIYDAIDPAVHPRALFFAEDIPEILRDRAEDVAVLRENIRIALEDGVPYPPYTPSFQLGDRGYAALQPRIYTNYIRQFVDRNLIALGLGWCLLGDKAAAELGKRILLEIASWDHNDDGLTHSWRGGDEAALTMARCFSTAYDLLYDVLTDAEREAVCTTLSLIARHTYERIINDDFEHKPGASHTGRIPAYLGQMAIMLKGWDDEATVRNYLNVAAKIYGGIFPHFGQVDGGWGEGPFYASSYTKWYLPFFSAVERYTGKSYLDRPFYQNLSNYFLHFGDPDFENHPFGDGYWCHPEDDEWPGFFAQDPFRVYAERFGPEEARATEARIKKPACFELHLLDVFLPRSKGDTSLTRPARLAEGFIKTGVLSMRSTFGREGCLAVLARASRFASSSHSHSDQGSFALFYEGTALISPSGYYGWGFGTQHHREWTNQSRAHNTLLVDGVGQATFSEKPTSEIAFCRQEGDLFEALLDLDNAYPTLASWKRRLVMDAAAKTLIVEDTVTAAEGEVTLDFLLHTLSRPTDHGGVVTLERNGITLRIEVLEGLLPTPEILDTFAVDLNEGVNYEQKAVAPEQFHIRYTAPRAAEHKIRVRLSVEKE